MMDILEKKQRACAAARKWRENNREKYLSVNRENARRQHEKNPLYSIWMGMLRRCGHRGNDTEFHLKNYAWRGIKVCDEWHTFEPFKDWCMSNGWKKGLQLDRIDTNGNYCPENCRFVTAKENCGNRRTSFLVRGVPLVEYYEAFANKALLSYETFYQRVRRRGWPVEKALYTPLQRRSA